MLQIHCSTLCHSEDCRHKWSKRKTNFHTEICPIPAQWVWLVHWGIQIDRQTDKHVWVIMTSPQAVSLLWGMAGWHRVRRTPDTDHLHHCIPPTSPPPYVSICHWLIAATSHPASHVPSPHISGRFQSHPLVVSFACSLWSFLPSKGPPLDLPSNPHYKTSRPPLKLWRSNLPNWMLPSLLSFYFHLAGAAFVPPSKRVVETEKYSWIARDTYKPKPVEETKQYLTKLDHVAVNDLHRKMPFYYSLAPAFLSHCPSWAHSVHLLWKL